MSRLSTRAKVLIGVVVLLVLGATAAIAGPIIYRDVIAGPADDAPTTALQDDETLEPSTLDENALAGEWTVTNGSFAGYRVDEVLNGTEVTVTGRTEQVTGAVTASETEVTSATITVDVASIATDSSNRDAYFRDQALRVSEHPTATFELTSPIPAPSGTSIDTPQTVTATGILTLAGVSSEVSAELTVAVSGDTVRIAGQVPIAFADYGVEAPTLGFVQVEPTGFVEFLIVLAQS